MPRKGLRFRQPTSSESISASAHRRGQRRDDVQRRTHVATRRKQNLQRKRLQRRNTRGAKKKLKRVGGKEARFQRHENHCITKRIVASAKGTGRGIALEDLGGIRTRITASGTDARNRLSGWWFGQLYDFITYKATLAGVAIVTVDPRNTSRTCAACDHCAKSNRKSQSEFVCKACGHRAHADLNAARNLRALALSKQALELDRLRAELEIPRALAVGSLKLAAVQRMQPALGLGLSRPPTRAFVLSIDHGLVQGHSQSRDTLDRATGCRGRDWPR